MSTPANAPLSEADERNYSSLGNLLGIIGGFIPSLIVWIMFKDRSSFVDRNMKSALNFQISVVIYVIAAGILTAVTFGILSFLYLVIWVLVIVFSIMGFMKNREGTDYKYPLTIPIVK